jgi:excinuclease ABC subunit A
MQFLPDLKMQCDDCEGKRFRQEVLEIRLRDRTIADVLAMPIHEAISFFRTHESIVHSLQRLVDVGLGYLQLGQPTSTMSSGERQRLRLASFLHSAKKKRTLYLLDEPTNGLHFADVGVLLKCFHRLLESGQSIVVVEHRSQVLGSADWVIELD